MAQLYLKLLLIMTQSHVNTFLNGVSTVLDVHTRVADLYSSPHDQIKEQLRLTIETIKERQESELINNPEYGLLEVRDR